MNEVSKLRGLSPVSPASNRVWKAPKERKPEDRPARRRNPKGKTYEDARDAPDRPDRVPAPNTNAEKDADAPPEYGADGLRKRPRHKLDVEA